MDERGLCGFVRTLKRTVGRGNFDALAITG
jgi:hypothetical protein